MAKGVLAGGCGGWEAVVKAANAVFGASGFTLLSEGASATDRARFESAVSLSINVCYPRGRAFDKKREVRWREAGSGQYVITYLSEDGAPPLDAGLRVNSEQWQTSPAIQKLYGTWSETTKDWVEVAVPGISQAYRTLVIAAPPPNALQIAVVDYSKNGLVQMTRFCAVEPYRD
jgi:hypothetical protein